MNWKYFYLTLTNVLNVFGGKEFKNPHMFDNRSTIVHLFEWKFTDIEKECKFLGEKYFGGVQISPIQESKIEEDNNSWYLRYQPISYKISSKSGSLEEFQQMITTCHEHKIRIYVDVVLNQMANGENEIIGYNGSTAEPTRLNYPAVPYTSFDFNEFCYLLNKSDAFEIRNCRLADLPDLNQAKDNVRSKIVEFLNKLIEYGVAGFRIDAVKHMWPLDLMNIYKELNDLNTKHGFPENSKPFIYQEVQDMGGEVVSKTEYIGLATVTEFMYSHLISTIFKSKKPLHELLQWGPKKGFAPSSDCIVFVDNQDNQRQDSNILNFKDKKQYILANIFMLAHPFGLLPRVMSSFEFVKDSDGPPCDDRGEIVSPEFDENGECLKPWICEHRWKPITSMVEFRSLVRNEKINNWADNGQNQIAFCVGNSGYVAINNELSLHFKSNLTICVKPGTYCDIISGSKIDGKCTGDEIVVNDKSKAEIFIPYTKEIPATVIHVNSKLP